jgi:16S rRNA (uracil1498-N3)-methyltransferase
MSRFFLTRDKIENNKATLEGTELGHMKTVLRLKPGQSVFLFDDEGWEHEARIQSYGDRSAELEILKSYQPARESPLAITLAQAVGKGEKMDWVVEKATELGVHTIVPFFSSYTVPRLDSERAGKRRSRWEKIALSAVKQSGRTGIPTLLDACDFQDLVRKDWSCDLKLLLCPGDFNVSMNRIKEEHPQIVSVLLVIGPEGGLTSDEVLQAEREGFKIVHLGRRILRTETAAVSTLTILQLLWGDLG